MNGDKTTQASQTPEAKNRIPLIVLMAAVLALILGGLYYYGYFKPGSRISFSPSPVLTGEILELDEAQEWIRVKAGGEAWKILTKEAMLVKETSAGGTANPATAYDFRLGQKVRVDYIESGKNSAEKTIKPAAVMILMR